MGLNFHVGLPGPFAYTRRIGGRRRAPARTAAAHGSVPSSGGPVAVLVAVLFVLAGLMWAVWVTGTWPFAVGIIAAVAGVAAWPSLDG